MPVAGHATTVRISGTAVPVTGEACALLSGVDPNEVYQVTNTARRIWDPNAAIVVKDNAVTVPATDYVFDYLFGIVRFSVAATGPVTVDGSYLPTVAYAECSKASLKRHRDLLDRTTFDSAGVRQRLAGLQDLEGSLTGLAPLSDDLDAGVGGTQSVQSFFDAGTPKLLEIRPGGTGNYYRAWILFEDLGEDASFDGLVERTLAVKGTALTGSGQSEGAAAGWGS